MPRRGDHTSFEELLDLLLAEALDVEGAARDEILEPFDGLGRTDEAAGATAVDLVGIIALAADGLGAAERAFGGKVEGGGVLRPLFLHHPDDLWDDVAGALDDDPVLQLHAEARDLVLVVQRGVLDDDAADADRLEAGDGGELAGAADLDVDVREAGSSPARQGICGLRPSAASERQSRALLPVEPVDLVDNAIDS